MNTKIPLYLWEICNALGSMFLSFFLWFYNAFRYGEMHNTSTAGEHEITARALIRNDIVFALGKSALCIAIIAALIFGINEAMCDWLGHYERRRHKHSPAGWRMFVVSTVILCMGPIVAAVSYYIERAPYFSQ